ncbi:MAG: glycerophosphodiester phosphodiesterase [Actinomycetota bacterium]
MVLISAHSGHHERLGQAGYEAYQRALRTGADYAEMDIRRTADGVLVAYHDAYVMPGRVPVASLSYQQMCRGLGYPVPKVADVMSLFGGKFTGHLDLKETGYEAEVVELAKAAFGRGNFVVTTLEDESVSRIKRSFPDVTIALSLGRDLADLPWRRWPGVRCGELFPLSRIRACGADWVAVHYQLARLGVLRSCWRHGIRAMVWTVDSDALIDRFVRDPRVEVLITNRPEYAVRRRAALAG